MKKEKKPLTTVQIYKRLNVGKWALWSSKYVLPCIPAVVITAVNWEEWFMKSGASLPFGFATLLISVLLTIIAITKGDKLVNEHVSKMYVLTGVLAVWSISFMFLANIMQQIGQMLLWTTVGVLAGSTADQVEKSVVTPRLLEYKDLIDKNCLDAKAIKRKERVEKARLEGEKLSGEEEPTE